MDLCKEMVKENIGRETSCSNELINLLNEKVEKILCLLNGNNVENIRIETCEALSKTIVNNRKGLEVLNNKIDAIDEILFG